MWRPSVSYTRLFALLAVALAGLVALLWFVARPAYRKHREQQAVRQANGYLVKREFRNASLCARQALQYNSSNLRATEIMAELAEMSRSPLLLHWRQKVVELNPAVTNKLLLAAASIRYQAPPFPIASQIFEEAEDSATNISWFHMLSAEMALKLKKPDVAEASFARAVKLDPTNDVYQMNLAVLRLRSTNSARAADARAVLERLGKSPQTGPYALRWLISDAVNKYDLAAAQRFSRQLLDRPGASIDDRMQHLTLLKEGSSTDFLGYMQSLRTIGSTNAVQAYALCTWMNARGMTNEAFMWITNLPPKLRAEQPAPLGIVDCYVAVRDWAGLEHYLQAQAWGDLDFLRLAYLSQAALRQKQERAAETRWTLAVQKAADRIGALTVLVNMAYASQTDKAREDLLWTISRRFPREKWALRELERYYVQKRSTALLYDVYSTLSSYEPKNYYARNNYAATALLLGRNLPDAHEAARQLYSTHTNEPVIVSTYAYSLHLQGKTKAAIGVLQQLPEEDLEAPGVALYYGALLAADRQPEKAVKYLGLAKGSALLPEEQKLLAVAETKQPTK